jgi:general secretion pathway protein D
VIPALAVARQLLQHRPEILFDVEFVEVVEDSVLDYGLNFRSSFPIVWLSRIWNSKPQYPSGFSNFGVFGGGLTRFGVGIVGAETFARFSQNATRTLLQKELRTSDGLPASLHIGDRYPVMTAGFFGDTSGPGEVFTPPPTFNFEDLGVVLKITPKVHGYDDVSLEVDAEFKVLTGRATNGIPVIANRKILSRLRVRNGEWAVIAGLTRSSEARTLTGVAGLAQMPGLGPLFRQTNRRRDEAQTLFLIKPRLLTPPLSEVVMKPLWTGTETRPRPAL